MRRETTRPLIERIARELAEKWDASAKGPSVEPGVPEMDEAPEGRGSAGPHEGLGEEGPDRDGQLTSVDDMLRAAGKRVRPSRTRTTA